MFFMFKIHGHHLQGGGDTAVSFLILRFLNYKFKHRI